MADEIKITITATDGASKVFEDVVDSAESVKEAVDKLDGAGGKIAPPGIDQLPGKLDNVRDSADGAATALDNLGGGDKPKQIGWIPPDADKIPVTLDDIATAAEDVAEPVKTMTTNFESFGKGMKEVGQAVPGTLGDVAEGMGRVTEQSSKVEIVLDGVIGAAARVVTALGPVGVVATLGAVGISTLYLTGILGGNDGLAGKLDEIRVASDEAAASMNKVAFAMDDAATGLALAETNAELDTTIQNLTRLYEITTIFQGDNAAGDFASGAVEGIASFNEAGAEARRIADELGISWDVQNSNLSDLETTINSATTQQELLNNIMSHSGPGAEAARTRLAELNAEYASGAIDQETYNWNLQWMNENLVSHYDFVAAAAAAQRQYAEAAMSAAVSVGLLDTALEKMVAAGLNTDASMVALNLSTSALDSTFQTIVGTTNQLAAGSQAVADWAAGLTDMTEGLSLIGKAYTEGRITLDQYTDGFAAANRIQEDNAIIQAEIQAIQAQHLPLLADLTEQQRKYIEGLGDLSAEEQLAALGFMDSAQSAKAMELAYLAADAASGKLGSTGEATAAKIIEAAANADPVMKQMLLDMGLISEGAEGEVTVQFPNATSLTASVDSLTDSIDALTLALGGIPPSVTTNITATDNATSVIDQVKLALQDLDGSTASVYVATIGGGLTLGVDARNGGVVGYANGGMVMAELAEAGGELVRLASGGVAYAPTRGLYMIERGSNVMPAEASRAELDRRRQPAGDTYIYSGQVFQPITYEESAYARRRAGLAGQRR